MDCPSCAVPNAADARFCKGCGKVLQAVKAGGLAWKWVLLGTLIMFGTNFGIGFLAGFVAGLAGAKTFPMWAAIPIGLFAFGLGGYITGQRSPGRTIVEPGLAAFAAAGLTLLFKGQANLVSILIGGALPFLAGVAGGWLGERSPTGRAAP